MDTSSANPECLRQSGRALPVQRISQTRLRAMRWFAVALIVASVFTVSRQIPMERGVQLLTVWIQGLGLSGALVYAFIYAICAIFFVPGTPLTVAAGAVFGLAGGTAVVSLGSTLGAAASFLVARYLGRDAVARRVRGSSRFEAIDRALGERGWKIVVLLRLSPVMPFNLLNYMFGLTAVRFIPCILASWVSMLPGTFMLVYIGYLARTGLMQAGERTPGQWALMILGLAATVAASVYIARLARGAVARRVDEPSETPGPVRPKDAAVSPPKPLTAAALSILALAMLGAAIYTTVHKDALAGMFGPPPVTLGEAYEEKKNGRVFDHSAFDALLREHVDAEGRVDYQGIRKNTKALDDYFASLEEAPFEELSRDEKLSFLINAYNACTLRLILDHYPLKSIKDIPADKRWEHARWKIAGQIVSLNQIEHERIRPKFKEPRIHFALVCAAKGCPPLRNEAYTGARLEEQLDVQAKYVHTHDTWFQFHAGKNEVGLTSLYNWYGGDFEQSAGTILKYAADYSPDLKRALDDGKDLRITYLPYDWSLNEKE
ncbi:MAG: VTT domain-containing protein [Planctomycetota bacterium]|nr:VTT domain-containing protein [Planctomycetota bacterium]